MVLLALTANIALLAFARREYRKHAERVLKKKRAARRHLKNKKSK